MPRQETLGVNFTNSVFIPQSLILRSTCVRLNFNLSKLVYEHLGGIQFSILALSKRASRIVGEYLLKTLFTDPLHFSSNTYDFTQRGHRELTPNIYKRKWKLVIGKMLFGCNIQEEIDFQNLRNILRAFLFLLHLTLLYFGGIWRAK